MLNFAFRTSSDVFKIIAAAFVFWLEPVFSAGLDREELLEETRALSSLDVLTTYQNSQMMLMYVELAKQGVTIQTPRGATAGPSATGQEKETDVSKATHKRPELSKSNKSAKSAEYKNPNGIFPVAAATLLNTLRFDLGMKSRWLKFEKG